MKTKVIFKHAGSGLIVSKAFARKNQRITYGLRVPVGKRA